MKCPGSNVEITVKTCPQCGEEVELFTGESRAKCSGCGNWVTREKASCIEWCPGAKQCFHHVFEDEESNIEAEGIDKGKQRTGS
jgi:ribosomal protein S27AE